MPTAGADKVTVAPGVSTTVDVLDNDRDPDGDTLSITNVTTVAGATAIINNAGTPGDPSDDFLVIKADDNVTGDLVIQYTLDDGRGGTVQTTVTVQIQPRVGLNGNSPPVAVADSAATSVATPVSIAVLANDRDPDGDGLALVSWSAPSMGSVTMDDAGTPGLAADDFFRYTPAPGFVGMDSFTYALTDGTDSAIGGVQISVAVPAGLTPVGGRVMAAGARVLIFASDAGGNAQGAPLVQTVSDAAGEWQALMAPRNDILIVRTQSGFFLDDVAGLDNVASARGPHFNTAQQFETVLLPDSDFAAQTVLSSALLLRARYLAQTDTFAAALDRSRADLRAAFGFDPLLQNLQRPLLPATAGQPLAHYMMVLGGMAYNLSGVSTALLQSVPTVSMLAAQVRDLSDCALDGRDMNGPITVDVAGALVAMRVSASLATEVLRFRNNFAGQFGGTGFVNINPDACQLPDLAAPVFDSLPAIFSIAAIDALGTASASTQVAAALSSVVARDAGLTVAVTHDAPPVLPLGVTTVTFQASDASGNSATATADFVVTDQTAPVILAPSAINTAASGALTTVALGVATVSDNVSTLSNLLLSNDAPAAGFAPGVTIVTWQVTDEAGLTASTTQAVTITSSGSPVVLSPIVDQGLIQGTGFTLDAGRAFADPDGQTLSFALLGLPAGSGFTINAASGLISGMPTNSDALASPLSLTVVASDGTLTSGASFTAVVANVNDAPWVIAPLADISVTEGAVVALVTAGAFIDIDGDTLSFTAVGLPPSLAVHPATGVVSGTTDDADVTGGPWDITITASDGIAGVSDVFRLTVLDVNDAPTVVGTLGSQSTTQGAMFSLSIAGVFADADGDTLTLSATGLPASLALGTDLIISGLLTNADALTGTFGVTLTADDGRGGMASTSFVLAVANVNDAPVVAGAIGPQNALEDSPFSLNTRAAFDDIDGDVLALAAAGLPPSLTISPAGVISGTPVNADFLASPFSVTITASDPGGLSVSDTFNLMVNNTNDAPTLSAISDPAPGPEDLTVGPLAFTVGDAETAPGALSVSATSSNAALVAPAGISLGGSGAARNITLTPVPDANGSATITITANDGAASTTETFTVVFNAVNDAPAFFLSGNLALSEDFTGSAQVTVTAGAPPADEAGQTVSYTLSPSSVPWANVSIAAATGSVTVTAVADASGSGTFTITADDAQAVNNTSTRTFDLDIAAAADPPVPMDDNFIAGRDQTQMQDVLANDSDPDGDTLTLTSVTTPTSAGGSVVIDDASTPGDPSDDVVVYTPAPGFTGADSYSYSVSDGETVVAATVTIAVTIAGYVAGFTPAADTLAVATDTDVVITFAEPMNPATMIDANLILATDSSGAAVVAASVAYDAGSMTATLTPGADLTGDTRYWVFVSAAVENAAGFAQGFVVQSAFKTLSPDSDSDGVPDVDEIAFAAGAHPCLSLSNPDSDGDGLGDGVEIAAASNPCFDDPSQSVYYVDPAGAGGGWAGAVTTLPDPPGSGTAGSPTIVLVASGIYNDDLDFWGGCDDVVFVGSLDPNDAGQQPSLGPRGEPSTIIDMGGVRKSEFIDCMDIELRNLHLRDGTGQANTKGGGLRASGDTTVLLDGVWMSDSSVGDQGGGLGVSNFAVATVRNSVFYNNIVTAGKGGGGIWVGANAELILEDSFVFNNEATGVGGGGVYFDPNSTGTIVRSVISGNSASGADGGGVFILGINADVTIRDTIITGNYATHDGGGVYVDSAPATLHNLLVSGNRADGQGGGLAFAGSSGANASNLTVVYNESPNVGAGVAAVGSQPVIVDSVLFNNRYNGRTLAVAATNNDTFSAVGAVQSNFNLVEIDNDGASDIDLTAAGRTPEFVSGYYLNQASSLAVNSGSRSAAAATLDTRFTDAGGDVDTATVDRGWHYAVTGPGTADSVSIVAPATGLAAFAALPQSIQVQPLGAGDSLGVGRYVVFRLVAAPPGFAWATATTSLEPAGPSTVLADDIGGGVYQVKVDLSATSSGSAEFEVIVDGISLGTITLAVNP